MEWYWVVLIVLIGVIVLLTLLYPFILGYILYLIHMVRTKKSKWSRQCSAPNNKEQIKMWNEGLDFIQSYKNQIQEVHIQSNKLNLYGEYVDNHAERCVILLGGRCECLYYGYYYAKPYLENDCNVLVIDSRAHGKSDGKINTVGFFESIDLIQWAQLLHDKFHNKEIYIHGTCIGAATGIHALAHENCPKYITKMITDGLYPTYYDTFKNHMIEQKRPLWPALDLCFFFYKLCAKIDSKKMGPITLMDKIHVDIMLISSLEDKYVFPKTTKQLYDLCPSKHKEFHLLPKGGHSHLRVNQPQEYDQLVVQFINKKYE